MKRSFLKDRSQVRGADLAMPRWWPSWAGIAVLRALAALPLPLQRRIGAALGGLLYRLSAERRHITRVNLELAFPERRDHEQLARAHFRLLGQSVFEMAYGWWGPRRRLERLGRIVGREHLDEALARGRGVILLQGHFLSTDIAGQILGMQIPFVATYAPPRNPVAKHLTERLRGRFVEDQIPHTEVRRIVRVLADNRIVWHGPDQGAKKRTGIRASFFGHSAQTTTATAKLARISGAAVVPYHPLRLADGSYELRIEPPLKDFPGDDIAAATQRVNDIIEAQVRVAPEQYLWSHRRFKAAGPEDPDPYRAT